MENELTCYLDASIWYRQAEIIVMMFYSLRRSKGFAPVQLLNHVRRQAQGSICFSVRVVRYREGWCSRTATTRMPGPRSIIIRLLLRTISVKEQHVQVQHWLMHAQIQFPRKRWGCLLCS